ncbi:hypothetical protein ACIF8T_36235 [Streptomyces sp. NPDC085946]|uniref:hypothetical protein n=1 Tax=Streptomyces sp. NPDC085946 TaxID=3365744 RepID=UPI0037D80F9F
MTTATAGIHLLTVADEIDQYTVSPLRQALDITGIIQPRIVLDLRHATFMGSSGINAARPRPRVPRRR